MRPVHNRQPTILEPRDYAEYLTETERPPLHLLRILPGEEMQGKLVESNPTVNVQVSLFNDGQ